MWGCIWRRHQHEFMDRVDEGDVSAMLHGVPGGLPSDALVAWLPHALADLLLLCPPALPAILRWTLARIRSLESREKAQWPDNALRVGHAVLGTVGRALSGPAALLHLLQVCTMTGLYRTCGPPAPAAGPAALLHLLQVCTMTGLYRTCGPPAPAAGVYHDGAVQDLLPSCTCCRCVP
ncbi:uncharacterized protein LOC125179372 [Hyalella azteca]|uniref:Uncharacterized protein LOC125179372 n=1 Tax=Hyalella azteca TaxID=294128 RepID=A0A979FXC3_HYAAZ|nr:uncharacterized protein LOC125179372 [Hyalella azteca]